MFLPPFEAVVFGAVGEFCRRAAADSVPDLVARIGARGFERLVPVSAFQRHARRALADRSVIASEQAGAHRKLGGDLGEVARFPAGGDDRLPEREAFAVPELLDEFRAADADELKTLEIHRVGKQDVGNVVRFVARVGEGDDERKTRHPLHQLVRIPERNRGVGPVKEPRLGQRHARQPGGGFVEEHPGKVRRAERLAPRPVRCERHHAAVSVADVRLLRPVLAIGRVERIGHEAVRPGFHALLALRHRPVQPHGGAERASRHFESAHQDCKERPRPATFEPAPAVGDGLAQTHGHRPQRQRLAFDLDGLADPGSIYEFVCDAPHALGRHVADRFRPFGGIRPHVENQLVERRHAIEFALRQNLRVRANLDGHHAPRSFECGRDQRLPTRGVAQVVPIRADKIRRRGVFIEEADIEALARQFVQHYVDQCKQERGIGLGLDRYPFGRARAGHRKMRLDLYSFHAAFARIGVAPDPGHAARSLHIRAARDQVVAQRRVRRDGKPTVPELAVKMLRVVALHALPRSKAHVHRTPRGQVGGESTHIGLRSAAAAEARRYLRIPGLVQQPGRANRIQFCGDRIESLFP